MNDPPIVPNQTYSVGNNMVLEISAANGLLKGAVDVDGDPMEVFNYTQPANGNVTVQKNGAFVYSPKPQFAGTDTISFVVTDNNGGFTAATASVTSGGWLL